MNYVDPTGKVAASVVHTTAVTLAAADGPLPVGDLVALGVEGIYWTSYFWGIYGNQISASVSNFFGYDGSGGGSSGGLDPDKLGKVVEDLSKTALKHPLNKHTASRFADQVRHLTKEKIVDYCNSNSFFNPSWSENQVVKALNHGYKEALAKGITNGKHVFEIYGEKVLVVLRDGNLSTGYGFHKLSYEYFMSLVGR